MLSPLGVKVFHWFSAIMTVPFGIGACLTNTAEKVEYQEGNTALDLPRPILIFVSRFVHLTLVSHELTAVYFGWALLRDHGILERKSKSVDHLEAFFAMATAMGIFVATVFWAAVAINPALMLPVEKIFPAELKPDLVRRLCFQAFFGPPDPDPRCAWQKPFSAFMKYIHTFCPLLLVADAVVVRHALAVWDKELRMSMIFIGGYLAWNFFGWRLLRTPPYPLQRRIGDLGIPQAIVVYTVLVAYAIGLWWWTRSLRMGGNNAVSWLLLSIPVLAVLWASCAFVPFTTSLARYQQVKLDSKGNVLTIAAAEAEGK